MYTVALTNRFDNIIESHVFDTHEDAVDTINNIKDYIEKNNKIGMGYKSHPLNLRS